MTPTHVPTAPLALRIGRCVLLAAVCCWLSQMVLRDAPGRLILGGLHAAPAAETPRTGEKQDALEDIARRLAAVRVTSEDRALWGRLD